MYVEHVRQRTICYTKDLTHITNVIADLIIAIAVAELQARRIARNPQIYDKVKVYYTIEAIKKIKELYLPE